MVLPSWKPSTIASIKRRAKKLKDEEGLAHARALDRAAQLAGFQNFTHARRAIADQHVQVAAPPPTPPDRWPILGRSGRVNSFLMERRVAWAAAVTSVSGGSSAQSTTWRGVSPILGALQPFMGESANHAHFPSGGGHDFLSVARSVEPSCIEFKVSSHIFYVAKPRSLTLERIEGHPAESFMMLELAPLEPSRIYKTDGESSDGLSDRARTRLSYNEPLVDLGGGRCADRAVWDASDNEDEPLPIDARVVHRLLHGTILLVTKGSLWNGGRYTYTGAHHYLGRVGVRALIEQALGRDGLPDVA